MSTLEKTIALIDDFSVSELEDVYRYALSIHSQRPLPDPDANLDDIFSHLVGLIPDTGKTLENYRNERMQERYGITD